MSLANPRVVLLTDDQTLDVLACVQTIAQRTEDPETRARLVALLDNLSAQTGATYEGGQP